VDTSYPGAQWAGVWINIKKLFYVQNYFSAGRPGPVPYLLGGHTWTLAVEEHFYFLLPLLLAASGRYWRKVLPAVALGLLAGCLAIRLRNYGTPMDWVWDYQVTHKRIDSLFFGALLAYLSQTRPSFSKLVARFRMPLLAAGLLLISPMFFNALGSPFVKTFGYLMLALGYGCILLAFVSTPLGEGVLGRALDSAVARGLAWVGLWSYSIYLWHMDLEHLFQFLVTRAGGRWSDLWTLAYLAGSIGLGVFMGRLIEGPALAWRDRHFPSRSPAPPLSLAPEPAQQPGREDRAGGILLSPGLPSTSPVVD
jgi:peptidoglycan/LPS O-acetylase OafA/YrhL